MKQITPPPQPPDERGQAMVEFAVSALVFVLLTAALLVLGEAAEIKTRTLLSARYAAWLHLTARDTDRIARLFFEGPAARLAVTGGRSSSPAGLAIGRSLEETFGFPLLVYLRGRGKILRTEAEVTAEHTPAALRLLHGAGGFSEPFQAKALAVVATDTWDRLGGVELGLAVTGQWYLLPVLFPFAVS